MIGEIIKNNKQFKNWNIVLFLFIIVSFIFLTYINNKRVKLSKEVDDDRAYLYKNIIELKNSTDKLTHFVRAYVSTGDEKYKQAYYDLINIRDGLSPRPLNYNVSYWEHILNGDYIEVEYGPPESVFQILKNYGLKDNELEDVKKYLEGSNELVEIELMAFDAVDGKYTSDIEKYILEDETLDEFALRILYNEKYLQFKQDIMDSINNLLEDVENMLTESLIDEKESLEKVDSIIFSFNIVFFIFLCLIIIIHLRLTAETKTYFQKLVDELYDTQAEILNVLGRAGEYRDNETGNHVLRVKEYSYEIAVGLGLNKSQTRLIRNAAAMHDIGKIGIPDGVLNKPGKYTDEEMKIMRRHSLIGYDIIGEHNSELLEIARTMALEHHEKINGCGYPQNLKGDEISIYAKIVSLGDVFDALTSERVYKEAWSVQEALDYIESEKGKSFDPEVVNAFMSRIDRILQIKSIFADKPKQ